MKPSQKLAEFIVREEVKKWLDEKESFVNDFAELIGEMINFEQKYGVKVYYELKDPLIAVETKS